MHHLSKYILSAVIIDLINATPARGDDRSKQLGCHVEKHCSIDISVSCEAHGNGAKCDLLPNGVSCQFYKSGELQVDTRLCPIGSDESVLGSSPDFDTQATSDAEIIIRRPDGLYDIKCNDGSRERVDRTTLDAGDICKGGSSSRRFQISCEGFGNHYFPSRSIDGFRFGSFIDAADCRTIAETSINQVTCASLMPGSFHITRISDGARVGERCGLSDCLEAALMNRQGVTCVPYGTGWRLITVKTATTIGTTSSFQACLNAVRFAREGVACVNYGLNKWNITRLSDGERLGQASQLDSCTQATDNAFNGQVCAPLGGDRWQIYNIATALPEPGRWSLDACITRL
jgi:hypothetical protein